MTTHGGAPRRRALSLAAGAALLLLPGCTAAPAPIAGEHVSVLGLWSGPEFDSFDAVASGWEAETGATVDWTSARDLTKELQDQVDAGTPPDIAVLPNVRLLHQLAEEGLLVPLSTVLDMDRVSEDYATAWIELGSDGGQLYGIVFKVTSKATIWYSPANFADAGYDVPDTWDEMIALADLIVADGRTPFSLVAPMAPGGGGWSLTDWISQIVLDNCGADYFDRWVAGGIPWTDDCVRQSFELFGQVVHTPGYVLGGAPGILSTGDAEGSYPLYTDPPGAYLYYMASFAQAFIASEYPHLAPGADYDTFGFPAIAADRQPGITVGADVVVMLTDTPAARSFMAYIAGADSQQTWIERGGFTSVNRSIPLDAYPDAVARTTAEQLTTAEVVRFAAGDAMPPSVQQEWWDAMRRYVKDPGDLDAVLGSLTDAAAQARTGG